MAPIRNSIALAALIAVAACGAEPETGMARGEQVYGTCVPCHGANGEGNHDLGAPRIAGLPQWYVEPALEKYEEAWRGGHPMDTVGIKMRSMALSLDLDADRPSVAQFVAAMPVPSFEGMQHEWVGGDAQAGQQVFQTCVACHGPQAAGNEAVMAPPLTNQHPSYLLTQLEKFKKGWRGTNPNDTWGATMRANALLLSEEDMRNVVAYIQTLSETGT